MIKTSKLYENSRRFFGVLLAFTLFIGLVPVRAQAASTLPFTDVGENDWFYPAVEYCCSRGIFSGTSDTAFSPYSSLTRAQVVTILGRELKVDLTAIGTQSGWADVPNDCYYIRYLGWATDAGLINGTSYCTFSPEDAVTRQDMATLVGRLTERFNLSLEQGEAEKTGAFLDADSVSDYAWGYVEKLRKTGVLSGSAGNFKPKDPLTRAEAAAIMQRFDERTVRCEKIEVSAGSNTVAVGEDLRLTVRYSPDPCSKPALSYTSSDTAVLTVSADGTVHGVHDGQAVVTVKTAQGMNASVTITVGAGEESADSAASPTAIRCAFGSANGARSVELRYGNDQQICTTWTPSAAAQNGRLTFTSTNSDVAEVSSTGLVSAVGSGTAQIIVAAANGLCDTLTVTVKDPTDTGDSGSSAGTDGLDQKNNDWIDAQLASIVTPGMSDSEKAEAIAEYLCDYMTYDYKYYRGGGRTVTIADGAPSYSEPYGVCQDYADRYAAFCKRAGLDATVEVGEANSGNGPYYLVPLETAWQGHAWNSVVCGGTRYYIDTCWMDGATGYDNNGAYEAFYSLSTDYWADHRQNGVRGTKSRFDTSNMAVLCCDGTVSEFDLSVGQQYYAYVPYRGYLTKYSFKKESLDGYAEERYCKGENSYGWEQVMTITHSGRQVITITTKDMSDNVIKITTITINAA